jgi:hypothetical protein
MNVRSLAALLALALVSIAGAADKPDKPKSDLTPPDKRRATVDLALKLTQPPTPEPLPADLAQPFNPAGFDLPDREERPASAAAGAGRGDDPNAPARPAPVAGDRETL